mmetsp:Transcript_15619/g.23951  ORF Transcript_15619/g.23951 Transcript_15619/m.23951 type:complete len:240 (-) Transcript_15619:514-1233(-)
MGCDSLSCLASNYEGAWNSLPVNLALLDSEGNIAYSLLSGAPVDGELQSLDNLPFVLNPDSGFFVLANQRMSSGIEISERGDETVRALRIKELVEAKLDSKLSAEDLHQIQTDLTDTSAKQLAKLAVHVGRTRENLLPADKRGAAVHIRSILKDFEGVMTANSKEAAVFSVWHYYFLSHFKLFSELQDYNQFRNFAANILISVVNNPYGDESLEDSCEASPSKPAPVGACTFAALEALS